LASSRQQADAVLAQVKTEITRKRNLNKLNAIA